MTDPYITAGHIRRGIHTIRDHYTAALTPDTTTDESGIHNRTQPGEPVNLTAIDTRNAALNHLREGTQFILEHVNSGTITALVDATHPDPLGRFIDTWALAMAEQHPVYAGRYATQSERHGRRLETLAKGWRTKHIRVGDCTEQAIVAVDGVETFARCPGELVAVFREEDKGLLPGEVTCTVDGAHVWSPYQWHDLGKKLGKGIA